MVFTVVAAVHIGFSSGQFKFYFALLAATVVDVVDVDIVVVVVNVVVNVVLVLLVVTDHI